MEEFDLIIIGNGAAGLSASIYGRRAGLKVLILSNNPMGGGQILTTYEVDNYMGLPGLSGTEISEKFTNHAKSLGSVFKIEAVKAIYEKEKKHIVKTRRNEYVTKAVFVATGASHRPLGVEGEKDFIGMGVSYCATCDGAFYKDKVVAVVGGGNSALEDAIYLSDIVKKVYLIHRRDEFRADDIIVKKVLNNEKIEILYDTLLNKIEGEQFVKNIVIFNKKTEEYKNLKVDGVFIAVGILPNTDKIEGLPKLDENGYILAGEDTKTSIPWIFAGGDVRKKELRQIITAASDGANAVNSIKKYISSAKL